MKNTFGQSISLTVFGESHGAGVGVVLDGLCSGLAVNDASIKTALSRRAPSTSTDTARRERDAYQILSGVFNGKTTGTPICIFIPNENTDSKAYEYGIARPSHADYAAFCKYGGYEDYRGGGHFSGRVTAGIVATGAILKDALKGLGISIGTHILERANGRDCVKGGNNSPNDVDFLKRRELLVLLFRDDFGNGFSHLLARVVAGYTFLVRKRRFWGKFCFCHILLLKNDLPVWGRPQNLTFYFTLLLQPLLQGSRRKA